MLNSLEQTPVSPSGRFSGVVLSPQEARIERGEPVGLIGGAAQSKRARIHTMIEGFRDRPTRLNVERAGLVTQSMRETEGQPTVLRWGKALAHVLEQHPIHIEDDELLVGSAGPSGRYAVVYCETAMLARAEMPTLPYAIFRYLSQPGSLNYGQAMAMSTVLMLVVALSLVAIDRFRLGEIGEF